jgi:cytochrome c biogenesis protein CcmG, thiol:disulfide interchange protein DsbE
MTVNTTIQPTSASTGSMTWRRLMWAVLVFGLVWIYWSRSPVDNNAQPNVLTAPTTGFLAPDFTLQTTTGDTIQLSSLRGQPVIVNFWATWCPPCRAEMPEFEQIWQEYKGQTLMILGVNQGENAATVERFERTLVDITFPILLDTTAEIANQYDVVALPTTFFIDAEGQIQDVKIGGPMDTAMLMDGVNQILDP